MIDWTTVILPYPHKFEINGGLIQSSDESGELEWKKQKGLRIEGSYSSSILIKTDHQTIEPKTHLWISGNPAKYLYGHNVTGSDNLCQLVADMAKKALQNLNLPVTTQQYQCWRQGQFKLKKVDINYMRHCGSREQARAMLRLLSNAGTMRHSGRGQFTGDTLYFAKRSRRRAIKVYIKGDELEKGGRKHKIPDQLASRDELLKCADDAMRIELVLLPLELKALWLQDASNWTEETPKQLFHQYISKITCKTNLSISARLLAKMPKHLVTTYSYWAAGLDPREKLSQGSYYRHRSALLEYGVDIGAMLIKQ